MQPSLQTERLVLRPFSLADAPDVQRLAGERRVSEPTVSVPHPYPDGAAEAWISTHEEHFHADREATFAVTLASSGELVGAASLMGISKRHEVAEVGYWIGVPFWNTGFCTEAVGRLIGFGEEHFGITRLVARTLVSNAASARVLVKNGFTLEGRLQLHVKLNGRYEDMHSFGRCAPARTAATVEDNE